MRRTIERTDEVVDVVTVVRPSVAKAAIAELKPIRRTLEGVAAGRSPALEQIQFDIG